MILRQTQGMMCQSQIQSCSGCFSGPKTMMYVHVHLSGALSWFLIAGLVCLEVRIAPACSSQNHWDTFSMCFVRANLGRGSCHGGSYCQALSQNDQCSQYPGAVPLLRHSYSPLCTPQESMGDPPTNVLLKPTESCHLMSGRHFSLSLQPF